MQNSLTSNKQKVTSNEQKVTSNEQKVTSNEERVTSNEQQAKSSASYRQHCFFTSGDSVDNVLVRLSLIEQIIKDANLMCMSFSVKHPETLLES